MGTVASSQSFVPLPSSIEVNPVPTRPPNCVCEARMPVSRMYAVTPRPVGEYVYVPLSGRDRWSMRSRPQGALDWVANACITRSGSTYLTRGSLLTASFRPGGIVAA